MTGSVLIMAEKIEFKTEVNKLLDIVINSLYSEKYIFLRELISNASDALDKLKYWTLTNPDLQKSGEAYKITITPDKDHNTLTISDNGIGMNRDDLINHIGTIAKSGTAEFLQNTKDNASAVDLIGKFGVGFYSAFMVAAKVEITTRRVDSDKAYKWISNGVDGFEIGDTICDYEKPEPLPPIAIDEPTMSMLFTINDSPFFGKEGKFVTSRHIHDRLMKELDKNLALRVRKSELEDGKWIVSGRGVLHLSVLIETMRREGYELQVGQPQVIFKEIDGVKCEPIEELTISVPEEFASKMIDMVTRRKGEMTSMESQGDRVNIEFDMPSRGIIGLRTNVLTASQGEAIMAHRFKEYQPYKGDIERRSNGSMIAMESGTAFAYAIDKLQDRGKFFIYPQDEVYAGQVVGEHVHENDLVINVTKSKKLTNMRASGSDDKARIIPPVIFSLEEALEYIKEDEYVEVTPKSMRMRKVILDELERKRANRG